MKLKYIIKRLFRDIPSSLFLTLGLALTFFLLLNSINLINAVRYEEEMKEKESYNFDKTYEIIKPNDKVEDLGGGMYACSSDDFDGRAFFDDVIEVCSEYEGNAYLSTVVFTRDNSVHSLNVYLCINEDHVITLENGDREVISSRDSAKEGIYVPECVKHYIESDKVEANGDELKVAGIIKDNSVDMSDDTWVIMWSQLSDKFKEVLFHDAEKNIYDGRTGILIKFQSNSDKGEENFKKIEKKLTDRGYIVKDVQAYLESINHDDGVNEYVFMMEILNSILLAFSIISCMYVVSLWMDRRAGELMIRKSFGSNIPAIIRLIIRDLFKLGAISMVLAIIVQIIYRAVFPTEEFLIAVNLENILLILGGMAAVVVLMLIVPVIKFIRITPATGIKDI